tara:strand:- start:1857 stop:2906 length:1050 start_codon:yes stop_codon:yes gene_type:complete
MALQGVYKLFNEDTDVVRNIKGIVSSGIWSGGSGTLTSFFTQSAQSSSNGQYYLDVYKTNPQTDSEAEVQFSVAYAHYHGSGSKGTKGAATGNRASAGLYAQLSNLILEPNVDKFTFAGGSSSEESVYAVSFKRARMKEKVDPGNWELHISGSSNASGNSKGFVKLIDDSNSTTNAATGIGGRVFNVVSGSISSGTAVVNTVASSQTGGGYGLFYPDLGLILLNEPVLTASSSLGTVKTSNTDGYNHGKLFTAIKGGIKFQARREERLSSTHFFCRAGNKEFNFSNNPTFFTASTGDFTQATFFKDPKTFITTIGLYNNSNELLAVAKLSKPVLKSYSREALIKVKLDF